MYIKVVHKGYSGPTENRKNVRKPENIQDKPENM